MIPLGRHHGQLDGVMVFDGVCHLCSGFVRLALRFDRNQEIRFAPIQSAFGRRLAESHGVDPDDPLTFLFFDRGRALVASDGVIAMLRRFPAPLRYLAIVAWVPRRLRDLVYRVVARNRYRLFGRRGACFIPTARDATRFMLDLPPADSADTRH
jgi:predicted DCC family thiol-disulfide oxidoreductase YuxK